jgi:hypothetical protein
LNRFITERPDDYGFVIFLDFHHFSRSKTTDMITQPDYARRQIDVHCH